MKLRSMAAAIGIAAMLGWSSPQAAAAESTMTHAAAAAAGQASGAQISTPCDDWPFCPPAAYDTQQDDDWPFNPAGDSGDPGGDWPF